MEPTTPPDEPSGTSAAPTEQMPRQPPPRRLTRSADDKVFAGVAGGLGEYFSVDPVILRVLFVVLTVAGGAGLVAYIALWLVAPIEGVPTRDLTPRETRNRKYAAILLGALFVGSLLGFGQPWAFMGVPIAALLVLSVVGLALWRRDGGEPLSGVDAVRRLVVVGGAVVLAFVGGTAAALASAAGGGTVVAGLIIAAGVVLTVAAFAGGARWLILPAIVLAIPLAIVTAADVDIRGGVGHREYRVSAIAELQPRYELGMGDLEVDLRDVKFPQGRTELALRLGMGDVVVRVPDDVCVASTVRIGAGYAEVGDRDNGGLDVKWRHEPHAVRRARVLHVNADIGMGALSVRHGGSDPFDRHGVVLEPAEPAVPAKPAVPVRPFGGHGWFGNNGSDERALTDAACAGTVV
jgi:phage shock protein PspC (stress-responsive transcriptional regulator)